jgi:hypothetical protein
LAGVAGGKEDEGNVPAVACVSSDVKRHLEWMVCVAASAACCQAADTDSDARILGVIPNYQTVSDPSQKYVPLTTLEKWKLFARSSTDPFNLAGALVGASFSQGSRAVPDYGEGMEAFADRFGAAVTDMTTQTFFSTAVLAPLFHQDPRYFRKGPQASVPSRVLYSMSRIFITRQDSGRSAFNFSGILGMAMGIALSNAYYPDPDVGGSVTFLRFRTSLTGSLVGNLLPEFWPDIRNKLHRHGHPPDGGLKSAAAP